VGVLLSRPNLTFETVNMTKLLRPNNYNRDVQRFHVPSPSPTCIIAHMYVTASRRARAHVHKSQRVSQEQVQDGTRAHAYTKLGKVKNVGNEESRQRAS